jgi:predicted TIM-barrel fold metal-dependent hydrolase
MRQGHRRNFLRGATGLGVSAGLLSSEPNEAAAAPSAPARPAPRKAIDTHIHVVHSRISGGADDVPEEGDPLDLPLPRRAEVIRAELEAAGIEHALCMPRRPSDEDALGINETVRLAELVPALHPIGIADPRRTDAAHLDRVEALLKGGAVKGFKAYLGYLHYGPDSPGYGPYYELAARYDLPFIFHTGDTYSERAKVKYAHPLLVDEVAVDHPKVRFVMAHLGNPWLADAAEVLYKNNKHRRANVWTDLSGFVVGDAEDFRAYRASGVLKFVTDDIRKAFLYAERPDRFLYASDWPLAPMATYLDFFREVIPEEHHAAVFRENARSLFRL